MAMMSCRPRCSRAGGGSRALLRTAALTAVALATALQSRGNEPAATPFGKFDAILERAPFGPLPPPAETAEELAARLAAEAAAKQEPITPLSDLVRLSAITRFNGSPAAGLVDKKSNRAFFMAEGQTVGDYTLELVSFENGSVLLSKGGQTEEIALSYAHGQPTNIVQVEGTPFLTGLDIRKNTTGTARVEADANAVEEAQPPTPATATESSDAGAFPPEMIEAATFIDASGERRISFRELHRLRVQENRKKAELDKLRREAKRQREKELAAEVEKQDKLDEAAVLAAERLRRAKIITALKEGYDVEVDFELSVEEAKSLAEAGFEIPAEVLDTDNEENTETNL